MIKKSSVEGLKRKMDLVVNVYKSCVNFPVAEEERGFFSFGRVEQENLASEERYRISFDSSSHNEKKQVLTGKIASEQKRVTLGAGSQYALDRLTRRLH
jgi:hypothetical protein